MTGPGRQVHRPAGSPPPGGRWSHAVSVEAGGVRHVFIAGQTARRPDGAPLPPDDLPAQLERVYANLGAVLTSAGASWADVVLLRTFLVRGEDLAAWSAARDALHAERFEPGDDPVNTLVVVEGLAHPDLRVEVEAQAIVPLDRRPPGSDDPRRPPRSR